MNPHETMSNLMEGEMVEISQAITEKVSNVLARL
jgi:hypothetical protein